MPRLVTEWSTDDPGLAKMLQTIAAEPEYTSLRQELEGALHMQQARLCWQRAATYAQHEREQKAREARRRSRLDAAASTQEAP